MNQLTFLLYILSRSISSIRPMLILRLREWHEKFSAESAAIQPRQFCHEIGLKPESVKKFQELYESESPAQLQSRLHSQGIVALNLFEEAYAEMLREIPDPPLVIYCRGNLKLLNNRETIAMVGSRRSTKYGELVTQKIIRGLASSHIAIVSGLAYGIDSHAHKEALAHNLPTIAVLGSGINDEHIFPKENFLLSQEIIKQDGLILSEYPPATTAQKYQFVARNRIIAGLSQAVIVVEAAEKSGALITADFATEYNRTVMAVPGSIISPTSAGTLQLIQNGATPVIGGETILAELGLKQNFNGMTNNILAGPEARVLEYIQHEAREFESLIDDSGLSVSELQTALASLELRQLIKQISPQVYQKI